MSINDKNILGPSANSGSSLPYVPENVANKSTDIDADKTSYIKYGSVKAIYDWGVGLFQKLSNLSTDLSPSSTKYPNVDAVNTGLATKVNTSRTVNGQALTSDVSLSLDNLNDVTTPSPQIDDILRWNGSEWVNSTPTQVNAGPGVGFYYDSTSSDIATYKTINKSPQNISEQDLTVTANNNSVLINAYASPAGGLGGSSIEAGSWIFDVYSYASLLTLASTIQIQVYSRTTGGVETLLFTVNSPTLSGTQELYSISTIQQAFSIASTDRLVVKVYGVTSNVTNTTIHFSFGGTTHYSNFTTPLVIRHNDLAGLQGGAGGEYNHITNAQLVVLGNTSGINTGDQTNISGNAGTATILQNTRTIDGQNFNGSANITVIAPGTHAAPSKAMPVAADAIPLVDSADSNLLKQLTWANLIATLFTSLAYPVVYKIPAAPFGGFVTTGNTDYRTAKNAGNIIQIDLIGVGTSPTGTTDIWKISAGVNLPTVTNSICNTKPALATGNVLVITNLSGLKTTAVAANDIFGFNQDAVSGATAYTVVIWILPS